MLKQAMLRLARDKRGNFATIMGLAMLPLFAAFGIGIDFYMRQSYKARYDAAADAASIAAANATQAYISANASTQVNPALFNNARAAGIAQATKVFAANSGSAQSQVPVSPTFDIAQSGTQLTASVSYTGQMQLHFGPLVGVNNANVAGGAVATLGMTTFITYYMIVDTSQSMGIAATPADMSRLYAATSRQVEGSCVFGCHGHNSGNDPLTNQDIARNASPPIVLRIDAAKSALQNVITQARNTVGNQGNIKIGIYRMQVDPAAGTYFQTASSPTTDYVALASAASAIDLGAYVNNHTNLGLTDLKDSLSAIANILPGNGDGLSAASPKNYVFIISDGLQDLYGGCDANGHCVGPVDQNSCTMLKNKSTVGVIYTTYLPIYNGNNPANGYDAFYSAEVLPVASQLEPNMQNCATNPNLYFKADDGPALIAAMDRLFAATSQPVALSQ